MEPNPAIRWCDTELFTDILAAHLFHHAKYKYIGLPLRQVSEAILDDLPKLFALAAIHEVNLETTLF